MTQDLYSLYYFKSPFLMISYYTLAHMDCKNIAIPVPALLKHLPDSKWLKSINLFFFKLHDKSIISIVNENYLRLQTYDL